MAGLEQAMSELLGSYCDGTHYQDIGAKPRLLSTDLVELRQRAQRQDERIRRKQELLAVVTDHLTIMETCLHII
ncbi:hypothetical protein IWQ61_008551 [Dispira simplex]|nr:hypothetical protein IWQ61_008551 [Dispira simplex]